MADVCYGNGFSFRILGIDAVVSKGFVHRIELVQVLIASNPQPAGTIFEEG